MRTHLIALIVVAFASVACAQISAKSGESPLPSTNWTATENASLAASPGASGTSFDISLSPGPYPGWGFEAPKDKPAGLDLSHADAIRFNLTSNKKLQLSFRVDDVNSTNFATRFQCEIPLRVSANKDNELTIPVALLRQGNLFSRGIDVSKIKSLRFFVPGVKEEIKLTFSNPRLVTKSGPAASTPLATFDVAKLTPEGAIETFAVADTPNLRVEPKEGTKISLVGEPKDRQIKLDVTGGTYPGVSMIKFPRDLLGYDFLTFKISPAASGSPIPSAINIKFADSTDRKLTYSTSLVENKGVVTIPMEMVAHLDTSRIAEIVLFFDKDSHGKSFLLSEMTLTRLDRTDYPTIHQDPIEKPHLTLDYTPIAALGKSTVFMAMITVPLADGKTRMIRCNSETKGLTQYQIPAAAFQNAAPNSALDVWAYLIEHGIWHFQKTTLKLNPTTPQTLTFDDPKKFNH